ncbi:MAG TPA: hypothetical protein VHS58_19255 [Acetobacteraceae bacterium]|nr:hypothetical protein [Acetobacteraceae bacterium]
MVLSCRRGRQDRHLVLADGHCPRDQALAAQAGRTVRFGWRGHYPRRAAVEAVGEVIAGAAAGGSRKGHVNG